MTQKIRWNTWCIGKCSLLLFLFITPFASIAQQSRVLVENATFSTYERPVVLVKWYSTDLMYKEGVNIYRREEGTANWIKLNDQSLVRKNSLSPALLNTDPDLEPFVEMVKGSSEQELKQDMILLNVLLKSFQSNAFADFMGIYYQDKTATAGKRYEYRVSKLRNTQELILGVSNVNTTGNYEPDSAIQAIEIYQKGKAIHFNWRHEEDRFYAVNVYRKANTDKAVAKLNKEPIMLSQVRDSLGKLVYPKPMFTENRELSEGKIYTYQLAGVGFFGNETQWSAPAKVAFKDVTPPPAPKNLTGKADSMKVRLKWENVTSPDLQEIKIYRSGKSAGPFEMIHSNALNESMSYLDTVKIAGPYYYYAAASDSVGNEAHSDLVFVDVQDVIPPTQPQQITLRADTGRMYLSWKMGTEPDLAGYYIFRTVDGNKKRNYVLVNADPLKADHFEQDLPKNTKNRFYYYVVAVDTSFNRSKPSEYASGSMPDILPPERPFIKDITYQEENIVIEWIPNGDRDLAGYHMYRADTTKKFVRININSLAGIAYRYTDRDNASNTDYFYYLVATDSTGNNSFPSKERYARRVVEDKLSSQVSLRIKHSKRMKQVKLNWAYEASESLLGFVVYSGEMASRLKPATGLIQTKSFTDKNAGKGTYYQVRAYAGSTIIYSAIVATEKNR